MRSIISCLLLVLAVGCGSATARTAGRVSQAHLTGDRITLDDTIRFEHDSAVIVEESQQLIADIAAVLAEHTELRVVHVVGHTDASGDDAHNLQLSEARAQAVVDAQRERGVTIELDARGAGETEPVCTEDTDECHARNRRVEIIVES